jgi:hypothetical protein
MGICLEPLEYSWHVHPFFFTEIAGAKAASLTSSALNGNK